MFISMQVDEPSPHSANINTSNEREEGKGNSYLLDACCLTDGMLGTSHSFPPLPSNPRHGVIILCYRWRQWGSESGSGGGSVQRTQVCVTSTAVGLSLSHDVSRGTRVHLNWYFLSPLAGFTLFATHRKLYILEMSFQSFIKNKIASKKTPVN